MSERVERPHVTVVWGDGGRAEVLVKYRHRAKILRDSVRDWRSPEDYLLAARKTTIQMVNALDIPPVFFHAIQARIEFSYRDLASFGYQLRLPFDELIANETASSIPQNAEPSMPSSVQFLLRLIPRRHREQIAGDLEEEFYENVKAQGVVKARTTFAIQVVGTVMVFAVPLMRKIFGFTILIKALGNTLRWLRGL